MRAEVDFDDWVAATFDPGAEDVWPPPRQELAHLTRLFLDPVPPLAALDDDEIGVGLWSVLDSGGAGTALAIGDVDLPIEDRVACVRAIVPLHRALLVPRCPERLGHRSEDGGRLATTLYMFWDEACFGGPPDDRLGDLLEDAVLEVLEDVLRLPHAGAQESALHGLGHRIGRHPERAPAIIDRWLRSGEARDPRLVAYAEAARSGCIQ